MICNLYLGGIIDHASIEIQFHEHFRPHRQFRFWNTWLQMHGLVDRVGRLGITMLQVQ